MNNAKKASELVSKSLRQELNAEESVALSQHMENEETRKFAKASKLIQQSIVSGAKSIVEGSDSKAPSLCDEAKQRMRDSLNAASQEKMRLSQAGLLKSSDSRQMMIEQDEAEATRAVTSRFQVIRPLAEGGLGNVWLVRDEKMNRTVAMKELNREGLESPKAWKRFQREAEITGMLEHPNIIPIYQFGDDRQSGEPFYTMRFVGKKTLSDAIMEHHDLVAAGEEGPLGLHRLLSIFCDVCQAIAYAHSRGVVHRDLKPENIALDNFCQVIVLDWGLAKVLEEGELFDKLSSAAGLSGLEESSMTKTMQGDIVGTPLYMSPEQAIGDLDSINERTDIYGLGAVLFAILTGNAPHARSLGDSADLPKAVRSISEKETPRARDENPSISSELDKICAKAMAKKQHMRFATVSDFAESIEKWMAGQSDMRARYEAMRSEGRDLCSQLNAFIGGLERNVRFMSRLPPIAQLMHVETEEETAVWRERLAMIFEGLLDANSDYGAVLYRSVSEGTSRELVRVERHSRESNRIRIVPRSRLAEDPTNPMVDFIMQQKPGDVVTAVIQMASDENNSDCSRDCLISGVPVFDETTEDSFGLVLIDCDARSIMKHYLSNQMVCAEVVVVSGSRVLTRKLGDRFDDDSIGVPISTLDAFHDAFAWLQTHSEYIDTADASIYGRRIRLNAPQSDLLVLQRREGDSQTQA